VTDYVSKPLTAEHHTNYLDCGESRLDDWLDKHALEDQGFGKSRTRVWFDPGDIVIAYHTLLPTVIRETDAEPGLLRRLKPSQYQGDEVPGVRLIGGVYLVVEPMPATT
jgi:hypothetical protein